MMTRYPGFVAGSLLWLSNLTGLSVSQSTWTLDPQKHLAQMFDHMSAMANSTIYTIGGTTIYWTSSSTPFARVSRNNDSVYTLETANSFLRALDLSKPVDFESEFSDTSEVISELPFEIPLAIGGALWVHQNTIYYWGGKLLWEPIYLGGAFQNRTREWPDPMKYYTYDLNQPRGFGTWKTVSIAEAMGSDMLTSSPAWGEFTYAPEVRKGFYLGGVVRKDEFKNKDGSNATSAGIVPYYLRSMVVFNTVTNVWKNETIALELDHMTDGVMMYVADVGEEGILVRVGGTSEHGFVGFDIVYIYDIAAGVWYRQPTTSRIKIFPEGRQEGFCAAAVAAPDKTSFTIYIYGGYNGTIGNIKGTWALTMPYFQWIPMGSIGEPQRARSRITCHAVGGQLAIVRGTEEPVGRVDTNGGTYFYDMTSLTWSLKYQPSEYRVPKSIYDVIGGNGEGGASLTGPADDKDFDSGLGRLFAAAANRTNSPNPIARSYNSIDAIVGGVIGGVALLVIIGAGIWKLLRRCPRSNLVAEARI